MFKGLSGAFKDLSVYPILSLPDLLPELHKKSSIIFRFDKEIKYFHPYYIDPFKYKSEFGHMSQVAWAESDKIGCGMVAFNVSTNRYKIFYMLHLIL